MKEEVPPLDVSLYSNIDSLIEKWIYICSVNVSFSLNEKCWNSVLQCTLYSCSLYTGRVYIGFTPAKALNQVVNLSPKCNKKCFGRASRDTPFLRLFVGILPKATNSLPYELVRYTVFFESSSILFDCSELEVPEK
jgi:hypothetical protein